MRISMLLLCISAGQSFVAKRVVSQPFLNSLLKKRAVGVTKTISGLSAKNGRAAKHIWSVPSSLSSSSTLLLFSSRHSDEHHPNMRSRSFSSRAKLYAGTLNTSESRAGANNPATATLDSDVGIDADAAAGGKTAILADEKDFIKPDRDQYEYRCIRLPNNLQVLLVSTACTNAVDDSDVSTRVEAASVHVQAGHFDDTIAGLAHFNEHMLFLGTEKYPGEDEYEAFLSKYGGFSNAYTDMEDTNYYFSITTQQSSSEMADTVSDGLKGSLDRLAQFFIAPTFEESMVERELRAIDSEYRNGKSNDAWRNSQMLKATCNQKHPFSNFGCGNYETLKSKGSPIPELKKFWETYYKTSNIRLAVAGQASLDALQKTVEETFGALPYSNDPPRHEGKVNPKSTIFPREHANYDPENPAFGKEQLGKFREVIPLLETRTIKLVFATPPIDDPVLQKSKPQRVISHLLGHESPGSLHSLLNDMGYVTSLSTGTGLDTSDFSLFAINMSMTPKGMAEKDTVLDLVFQWIALIKKTVYDEPDLMSKYHDELRQISTNSFKFRENGDPTDFCSGAAETLFDANIAPNEILISGSLCNEYDPDTARAFADRFRPDNCMIQIIDSDLKQDSASDDDDNEKWNVEPIYGAIYRQRNFSPETVEGWENPKEREPRLHLPELNQYIPTDFSLRCDDDHGKNIENGATPLTEEERKAYKKEYPTLLQETSNLRMWHKLDRYWRVPKSFIRLSIVSPTTYKTPRTMTLSRIYQRVVNDDLNSFVYDASLAGCNYRISCVPTGYKISVRGYSEKLPFLLDTLTSRMLSLTQEMQEGAEKHPALFEKFKRAKDNLLRETKNYRLDAPYEIANYNSRLLMEENVWYLDNYYDEMEGKYATKDPLTMDECGRVAEECLTGRLKANAFCIGNIDEAGATDVMNVVQEQFFEKSTPLSEVEIPTFRSMKLPTKEDAKSIFGPEIEKEAIPVKYQELAITESEENNAVEVTLQVGSDVSLDYEGVGIIDLLSQLAYNSAYNQLRTREQLGYIVSAYTRRTAGGTWGLTVLVQGSSNSPLVLEERIEAWLKTFRQELEELTPERIILEARGLVAQFLEDDTKLSQEVNFLWGEIVSTETFNDRMSQPAFDRLIRLADELVLEEDEEKQGKTTTINGNPRKSAEMLKARLLEFFDQYLAAGSTERRAMSSRVFNQASKEEYEAALSSPGVLSTYSDMRYLKQFLSTWPIAPYWRKDRN